MEWIVSVDATGDDGSTREHDYLEALLEDLLDHGAAVSGDDTTCSVTLTVEAETAPEAAVRGAELVEKYLANAGEPAWSVVEVRAMTPARMDMLIEDPTIPELAGVSEVADLLMVSRQRASELARSANFPKPVADLRSGPVWSVPTLHNYIATWSRKPGRPANAVTV